MTLALSVPERRIDLDWLRIAAFGLLIFYHVGMFYVTWDWHVKSSHASQIIEPLMRLSNPWRLTLLFIISGYLFAMRDSAPHRDRIKKRVRTLRSFHCVSANFRSRP